MKFLFLISLVALTAHAEYYPRQNTYFNNIPKPTLGTSPDTRTNSYNMNQPNFAGSPNYIYNSNKPNSPKNYYKY